MICFKISNPLANRLGALSRRLGMDRAEIVRRSRRRFLRLTPEQQQVVLAENSDSTTTEGYVVIVKDHRGGIFTGATPDQIRRILAWAISDAETALVSHTPNITARDGIDYIATPEGAAIHRHHINRRLAKLHGDTL